VLDQLLSLARSHESRNVPATMKQSIAVARFLDAHTTSRDERLLVLKLWFSRRMTSAKDLTRGEAAAILELGVNPNWEPNPKFVQFIEETKALVYQF